jgi:hypothetical protein
VSSHRRINAAQLGRTSVAAVSGTGYPRRPAVCSARTYAEIFGYPGVAVHHATGEIGRMLLDVDPQPPYGRTPATEA